MSETDFLDWSLQQQFKSYSENYSKQIQITTSFSFGELNKFHYRVVYWSEEAERRNAWILSHRGNFSHCLIHFPLAVWKNQFLDDLNILHCFPLYISSCVGSLFSFFYQVMNAVAGSKSSVFRKSSMTGILISEDMAQWSTLASA